MKPQDILFQYLKDVVYNTNQASLDIECLPEDFKNLGQAMQLVGNWIYEAREMSTILSKGDLSYFKTDPENVFAAPMKELNSTLRHLVWQTQQVAKGDYTQKVDFMGDFSVSFNEMTKQLQERRVALIKEKQLVDEKNKELENAFHLIASFANYTHNMIFIYSSLDHKELFKNTAALTFLAINPMVGECLLNQLISKENEHIEETVIWDFEIPSQDNEDIYYYFTVESYPIYWENQRAVVHIVLDDTTRKTHEKHMYELAYIDPLTGLYNRRYALEQIHDLMERKIPFVLSFVDIDYLKYCNDTYGHAFGDTYLLDVAKVLQTFHSIVARTGGDEFMLIQVGKTVDEQNFALEKMRSLIQMEGNKKPYPQSFSYASCLIPSKNQKTVEDYLILVDALMYEYKIKNKKPLKDTLYKDDR